MPKQLYTSGCNILKCLLARMAVAAKDGDDDRLGREQEALVILALHPNERKIHNIAAALMAEFAHECLNAIESREIYTNEQGQVIAYSEVPDGRRDFIISIPGKELILAPEAAVSLRDGLNQYIKSHAQR
ncbi:MAG: hypothetical protein AAFX65_10535 [Cyanobacteria bacterium J06638_7]